MESKREHKKLSWSSILKRVFIILVGAFLVTVGLEIFLVPNHIIDGGIVGVSIILSYLGGLPLEASTLFGVTVSYSAGAGLYSLITYFIAFKMIAMTIEGFDETKSVWINSNRHEELGDAILNRLGRGVTYLKGEGGYTLVMTKK
ncbi:Uncharacterised 5xTM membrane BCR, YitT family COG1284 [Melghirimyces algeriensis]|uniref:Uncharacterized 5xTM membrane BCR, YitT family COG1284 n=1 Tax=Melghirimyces algeriensis TaxID=910412 RepID=A0A521C7G3_9BACL|nr:Uncharacterised 5xTM membrane BCR, YitT family COG1284 [Melghirimyces algeriensis]